MNTFSNKTKLIIKSLIFKGKSKSDLQVGNDYF